MESYPVQVNILLSHKDNDGPCDMWVTETLIFNILPLKKIISTIISRRIWYNRNEY